MLGALLETVEAPAADAPALLVRELALGEIERMRAVSRDLAIPLTSNVADAVRLAETVRTATVECRASARGLYGM